MGLELVLPSLIPVAIDGVRGLVNKFTGGAAAQPSSPDDVVKLLEADTKKMEAIAKLEGSGNTYLWVEAVRKLQRPAVGLSVLILYGLAIHTGKDAAVIASLGDWAAMYSFYLFGDRTYSYINRK